MLSGIGASRIFSIIARCSRLSWVWNSVWPCSGRFKFKLEFFFITIFLGENGQSELGI